MHVVWPNQSSSGLVGSGKVVVRVLQWWLKMAWIGDCTLAVDVMSREVNFATLNKHFYLLITNLWFFNGSKISRKLLACCLLSVLATIVQVYEYTVQTLNTVSISLCKVSAAFLRPNGIRRKTKRPNGGMMPVFRVSSSTTGIWW